MFHHHKTRSSVSQGLALIVVALIDAMSQEMVMTNGARKDVKERDRLFSSGFTNHSLCNHALRACRLPWIDQDSLEGGADRPSLSLEDTLRVWRGRLYCLRHRPLSYRP
jgi:hypothetical protein